MKYITFFTLLFPLIIMGQTYKCVKLLSKKDSLPIKGASIVSESEMIGYSSNLGFFCFKEKYDLLKITHVKYETKTILLNSFGIQTNINIYINERNEELNEVVLPNKKRKTKKILPNQSLLSKIGGFKGHMAHFNSIYATYLPNKNLNERKIIKNILVETSEGYWGDPKKQYMPFKVNLYTIDSITKLPNVKMLPDTLLVAKTQKKQKYVVVNIKEYFIEFPPEGIFVAIQTLPEYEYKMRKSISYEPPAFKIIKKSKKSINITYSKRFDIYGNIKKDWIDKTLPPLYFVYNFGIEVEILK